MKKKLLMLTIVGLFGYQLCQAVDYYWRVHNKTDRILDVKLILWDKWDRSGWAGAGNIIYTTNKIIAKNSMQIFQSKHVLLGVYFGGKEHFHYYSDGYRKIYTTGNVIIYKDLDTNQLQWKFVPDKEFLKMQKAEGILKPLEFPAGKAQK